MSNPFPISCHQLHPGVISVTLCISINLISTLDIPQVYSFTFMNPSGYDLTSSLLLSFKKPQSTLSSKSSLMFGADQHYGVWARATWIWMFCVFDPIVVESYSDCDTCAVKMRNSEPIKVVRHIPRNAVRIGTRSGCAVRGRACSARKADASHQALCCRPTFTNWTWYTAWCVLIESRFI